MHPAQCLQSMPIFRHWGLVSQALAICSSTCCSWGPFPQPQLASLPGTHLAPRPPAPACSGLPGACLCQQEASLAVTGSLPPARSMALTIICPGCCHRRLPVCVCGGGSLSPPDVQSSAGLTHAFLLPAVLSLGLGSCPPPPLVGLSLRDCPLWLQLSEGWDAGAQAPRGSVGHRVGQSQGESSEVAYVVCGSGAGRPAPCLLSPSDATSQGEFSLDAVAVTTLLTKAELPGGGWKPRSWAGREGAF